MPAATASAAEPAASRGYRLQHGEPLPEGIERVALGRLDHALEQLWGRTGSTPGEAVHEARKDLKKLRGLLRLVRGEIGDDCYRRENECFRDAARRLSGARDADAMVEALDSLAEELPRDLSARLRKALTASGGAAQDGAAAPEVVEMLAQARERVAGWPLERDGFKVVKAGLRRSYSRGRIAFRAARKQPDSENLHEWRKRVKDLWYHHLLLQSDWPEVMGPLGEQAHELSDLLGDDHDLAVLGDWAPDGLDAFHEVVERRRIELQDDAFALGGRLYSEKPKAFIRRQRSYWG